MERSDKKGPAKILSDQDFLQAISGSIWVGGWIQADSSSCVLSRGWFAPQCRVLELPFRRDATEFLDCVLKLAGWFGGAVEILVRAQWAQ